MNKNLFSPFRYKGSNYWKKTFDLGNNSLVRGLSVFFLSFSFFYFNFHQLFSKIIILTYFASTC